MFLTELGSVQTADLPIAEMGQHLRLGTGFADDGSEDAALEVYLRSALSAIEARTGKALFRRRFSWSIHRWHGAATQGLPVAPVALIESVTIVASSGSTTVLPSASYSLRKDNHKPAIVAVGSSLPTIPLDGRAEIVIEAGYGTVWTDIPADLRQAVLMLAATYYDHRHGRVELGDEISFGIMNLIEPYRALRISGGA